MHISREFLDSLGIVSVQISASGKDALCVLRSYKSELLELSFQQDAPVRAGGKLSLRILSNTGGQQNISETECMVGEAGNGWCSVSLPENASGIFAALSSRLSEMECLDEKYGRRKEMRCGIGKKMFREFGLSSPQQKLFMRDPLFVQPCAILDVSLHGVKIITKFENRRMTQAEIFSLRVVFENPGEAVVLNCHKVHARVVLSRSGTPFAQLSCQLLEPVHYIWKERCIKLLQRMETPVISQYPENGPG